MIELLFLFVSVLNKAAFQRCAPSHVTLYVDTGYWVGAFLLALTGDTMKYILSLVLLLTGCAPPMETYVVENRPAELYEDGWFCTTREDACFCLDTWCGYDYPIIEL